MSACSRSGRTQNNGAGQFSSFTPLINTDLKCSYSKSPCIPYLNTSRMPLLTVTLPTLSTLLSEQMRSCHCQAPAACNADFKEEFPEKCHNSTEVPRVHSWESRLFNSSGKLHLTVSAISTSILVLLPGSASLPVPGIWNMLPWLPSSVKCPGGC